MQKRITREEMQAAVQQLARTERGRVVLERLLEVLEKDDLRLPLLNQRAFLALLGALWAGNAPEVVQLTREALREPRAKD